jgi:hypothetical protein
MRKKIKRDTLTSISGFGLTKDNRSKGGESFSPVFMSVAPDYSLILNENSNIQGWGTNVSGVLNFASVGVSNLFFNNISAGYDHAVGVYLPQVSTESVKYNINYSSPTGFYDFSTPITGSWASPMWIPLSSSDPFSGFEKNITITGMFDAGICVKKYPNQNEKILDERSQFPFFFTGNFSLKKDESFSLEIYPTTRNLLLNSTNSFSVQAIVDITKKNENLYRVTGWGANYSGQINFENINSLQKNIKYAAAGNGYSLVLFEDGTVTGIGSNSSGQISNLDTLVNVDYISAGYSHSLFLNKNGQIFSRGDNFFGQRNIPVFSFVKEISAGEFKTIIIYENSINEKFGRVFATGVGSFQDFAYLNSITGAVYVNAGANGFVVVLNDGSILGIGDEKCDEFAFNNYNKNFLYAFNGWGFTQTIVDNGLKYVDFLKTPLSIVIGGSGDPSVENFEIDTAINKKLQKIDKTVGWSYEPSDYFIKMPTGQASFSLNSFLKISGSSLSGKVVTGLNFEYKYISDPKVDIYRGLDKNYFYFYSADNWSSDPGFNEDYKNSLISNGYINPNTFSEKDPAFQIVHNFSNYLNSEYFVKVNEKPSLAENFYTSLNEANTRYVFSIKNFPQIIKNTLIYNSNRNAFLTYDVRSGTNSKNVFAYAIELDKSIISKVYEAVPDVYSAYYYLPLLRVDPFLITGWHSFLNNFSAICLEKEGCEELDDKEPKEICIDGLSGKYGISGGQLPPPGPLYDAFVVDLISGVMKGSVTGIDPSNNSFLYETSTNTGLFSSDSFFSGSSGIIFFGDFFSGDTLSFEPYNFDYTGLYKNIYISNPPYKKISNFNLEFKKDFSTPGDLFNKLNQEFSSYTYNPNRTGFIWYAGLGCNTGIGQTGVFEKIERPLADVFYINPSDYFTNSPSESILKYWSGRIIGYKSNYYHSGGYNIKINKTQRRLDLETGRVDGFKFVLPNSISLYGSQDAKTWSRLHYISNINWTGIDSTIASVPEEYLKNEPFLSDGFGLLSGYTNSGIYDSLYAQTGLDIKTGIDLSGSGFIADPWYRPRSLLKLTKKTVEQAGKWCPPQLFDQEFDIFYIGSGITCKEQEDEGEDEDEDDEEQDGSGDGPFFVESLRTGWLIDFNNLGINPGEAGDVKFNYYKVELQDFKSPIDLVGLNPVDYFKVNKINFFSLDRDNPELQTGLTCWDGGLYEIIPSGNVPVSISGHFTADVRPQDSGVRVFENALMSGRIIGYSSGDYIRFNRASGRIVSNTGYSLYKGPIYATGIFNTGIVDWFYNPTTKEIDTIRSFDAFFASGSGRFSGSYTRIKLDVVNKDLAFGRWLNPTYDVNITTGVTYYTNFQTFDYESGITGYIKSFYNITGISTSGYINYSTGITGSSAGVVIQYKVPTGYKYASGFIKIIEPLLTTNDYLLLNDNLIFYTNNISNNVPPGYFDSFSGLCSILTGEDFGSLFNCSFVINDIDNSIIIISSGIGDSGNLTSFDFYSDFGGINGIKYDGRLSGGETYYQYISGTGLYSGFFEHKNYAMTGYFYNNSGSGFISGPISTYQGEREFSGIWQISTGESLFLDRLFSVPSISDKEVSGSLIGEYSGLYPSKFTIGVSYTNSFGLSNNKDAAKLTVFDKNYIYTTGGNVYITGSGSSIIIQNI